MGTAMNTVNLDKGLAPRQPNAHTIKDPGAVTYACAASASSSALRAAVASRYWAAT
ncbi:hypothetical protein P3T37_002987 [Kitasatospora sp. MAA4]|nr:hypothetical protein [Kitasatospora sp. MAA4]